MHGLIQDGHNTFLFTPLGRWFVATLLSLEGAAGLTHLCQKNVAELCFFSLV